jgi:hypothetical protein
MILQIDGVTPTDIINNANPFGVGIYGLLVLSLLIAIYIIWKEKKTESSHYREEIKNLRVENKEQVDTMLKISAESIPILTSAAEALKEKNGTNSIILSEIEKLKNDHRVIIDHVRK